MRSRASGFTLMEVLVALFISGLIMTSVLSSLDSTQRAVDAIHNIVETENVGPRILQVFRNDFRDLAVYDAPEYRILHGEKDSIGGRDADNVDLLVRRRASLPFHDPIREEEVYAPLSEVGWRLRPNPSSSDFMELWRREDFLVDDKPFEEGRFSLLYDRVINFQLLYFAEPGFDPDWDDEWDSEERQSLPVAVEIRLDMEVQPRKSAESRLFLGANRSRLEFYDVLAIPEPVRWTFRNRLHPTVPGEDEGEDEEISEDEAGSEEDSGRGGSITGSREDIDGGRDFPGGRGGGGGRP